MRTKNADSIGIFVAAFRILSYEIILRIKRFIIASYWLQFKEYGGSIFY